MIIQEERHKNEPEWLWRFGNWSALDSDWIASVGLAWFFKEDGKWKFIPRVTDDVSLFYNAVFFLRICAPIPGLFFSFRWSGASDKKALFQGGIGWKLNGRFAILARIQSDKTSAEGVTGPNFGQATGFDYGTH